ncbi:serine protease, partial [bacterium]
MSVELAEEAAEAGIHMHAVSTQCLCKVNKSLNLVNGFQTNVNLKMLKKLVDDKRVRKVWLDSRVHALLNIAAPAVRAPEVWNNGYKGAGIGVAVLDTGVYPHDDLTSPVNRITAFKDFVRGREKPYDD